ncbi:hypothetical protein Tco_0468854, partial [Tanacetum coccineum]
EFGYAVSDFWIWLIGNTEYWVFGYGVLAKNVFFLIFDQSIIYGVSMAYSSKLGNGLEFFKVFRYDSVSIRRIQGIGYGILGSLGVGTTFDIFKNIHILYLRYGVLTSSGNGVLSLFPLWSLGRLRCKGVMKQIVGVVPKGLALRVVLVDLHSKDESGKEFKLEIN